MYKVNEDYCDKIGNTYCLDSQGKFINMQPINEKLLRLSTKWTEIYASDILIFFEHFNKYFLEDNIKEIDFYFRQSGISWAILLPDGTEKYCLSIPDQYRGRAKLVFDGKNITLFWENGNC
jgi:hypothetical protein